jgi:hypothetical protein
MKTKILMVAILSMFSFATASAETSKGNLKIKVTANASEQDAKRAQELQKELDQIQALDYNSLSAEEKNQVKAEIKDIKAEVKQMDGVYIYLGGGALLIIILLIILL